MDAVITTKGGLIGFIDPSEDGDGYFGYVFPSGHTDCEPREACFDTQQEAIEWVHVNGVQINPN